MLHGDVIAHRGASGYAPENTLPAFYKAHALGVRWVEFDVQLTADDALVVFHDATLERTTNGQGKVAQTDSCQLSRLDAGGWFAPQYAKERIPSLAAVVDCLAECQLAANVELKPTQDNAVKLAYQVERFLQQQWPKTLPPPVISSYCQKALHALFHLNPRRRLGLLYEQSDWLRWAKHLRVVSIHKVADTFSYDDIRHYQTFGYPLVAGIVNDASVARQLLDWGVAGLFSDYPDRVMMI